MQALKHSSHSIKAKNAKAQLYEYFHDTFLDEINCSSNFVM